MQGYKHSTPTQTKVFTGKTIEHQTTAKATSAAPAPKSSAVPPAKTKTVQFQKDARGKSTPGGAIRKDAIPEGSALEYLAPGRLRFDGVEFRAVRDLRHMTSEDLSKILKKGESASDVRGIKIHGHHNKQQYHRKPDAFIVEIPRDKHSMSNKNQHPLGNKGGLSAAERKDWNKLRRNYSKERARTELLRRKIEND